MGWGWVRGLKSGGSKISDPGQERGDRGVEMVS